MRKILSTLGFFVIQLLRALCLLCCEALPSCLLLGVKTSLSAVLFSPHAVTPLSILLVEAGLTIGLFLGEPLCTARVILFLLSSTGIIVGETLLACLLLTVEGPLSGDLLLMKSPLAVKFVSLALQSLFLKLGYPLLFSS